MKITTFFYLLAINLLSAPLVAETLDNSFSNPVDLTDQQAKEAEQFVHKGLKDKNYQEGCQKQGLGKCSPADVRPQGMKDVLEEKLGMAYTMVFGGMGMMTGGGGPTFTTPEQEAAKKAKAAGKEAKEVEDKDDYCMYGAMGYEMLAGLMQMSMQDRAQKDTSGISDPQLASLVNLKEAHKARAKTANYQRTVYAAVTTCYIGYGIWGGISKDWKYWSKLGGATLLTGLYHQKVQKHKNAANKVQAVIDGLPRAGDCNPWTGTTCFCKEESSKKLYPSHYQEVCVLNNGDFDTPKIAMGCGVMVNGKMQFDKECKCKETKSCFTAQVRGLNPKFKLANNLMNQANQGFDMLSSGEYDEAKLNSYSTMSNAMAKKYKDQTKVKAPSVHLSPEQMKLASEFNEFMPANIAAIAATAPRGNSPSGGGIMGGATTSALEKLPETTKKKVADALIKGNYKSGESSSGGKNNEEEFQIPVFPGQESAKSDPGVEVINFAEKAISKADVSNMPDTPIFDIISNRYRRSGWDKLQAEQEIK